MYRVRHKSVNTPVRHTSVNTPVRHTSVNTPVRHTSVKPLHSTNGMSYAPGSQYIVVGGKAVRNA